MARANRAIIQRGLGDRGNGGLFASPCARTQLDGGGEGEAARLRSNVEQSPGVRVAFREAIGELRRAGYPAELIELAREERIAKAGDDSAEPGISAGSPKRRH